MGRVDRDPLADFSPENLAFLGREKRVHVGGSGPAVIVMAEIPGIHPGVAAFARRVRDAGFTVHMPSLFGEDGRRASRGYMAATAIRACITREFAALKAGVSGEVTDWLRALAAHAHAKCGGAGVGAIGMCFTGNFALSMMLEPAMRAPVLCQPSLPLNNPADAHISAEEAARVRARMEAEDLTCLAFRFAGDPLCREERFARYRQLLGDRFDGRVLPDSAGAPNRLMKQPHSVVTHHLIDREGEPTRQAVDDIISFFRLRLMQAAPAA